VHGPKHEAIRRRYIELRYRLLPYVYTVTEEAARTGMPIMRPMFLEYPDEADFYKKDYYQFLFGRDLLVAPPAYEFLSTYDVQLPAGEWFDYWTGQRVAGGKVIQVTPPLDTLPVYVRAGAILPQQPAVQHTDEVPDGPLELRLYPGPDCRGSLYADDGKSFAYARGEYYRVEHTCTMAPDSLRVNLGAPQGTFAPWWKNLQIEVFGVDRRPGRVELGESPLRDWNYDPVTRRLVLFVSETNRAQEVRVTY
jgi:alpha-glucosidase